MLRWKSCGPAKSFDAFRVILFPRGLRQGPYSGKETVDTALECLKVLVRTGEDLLVASADKPFRFPATFTFVVRSFTVLDGIGKGLDPRFDISEIAAPYARSLILEAKPQFAKLQQDFGRRLQTQVPLLFDQYLYFFQGLGFWVVLYIDSPLIPKRTLILLGTTC